MMMLVVLCVVFFSLNILKNRKCQDVFPWVGGYARSLLSKITEKPISTS